MLSQDSETTKGDIGQLHPYVEYRSSGLKMEKRFYASDERLSSLDGMNFGQVGCFSF